MKVVVYQVYLYGSRDKGIFASIEAAAGYCRERDWSPHDVSMREHTQREDGTFLLRHMTIAEFAVEDADAAAPMWDLHGAKKAYRWKDQ